MAAPSTPTPLNGTPVQISATGESSGLLYAAPSGGFPGPFLIGLSGTFVGLTLVVRGRMFGQTNFFPLFGVDQNTKIPVNGSGFSPADSTQNSYLFQDAPACDQIEVYASALGSGNPAVEVSTGAQLNKLTPVPNLTLPSATAATTITAASATALVVGPNGTTNPTLQVATNTSSAATGVKVTSAAAGSGVAVATISSGTNENATIDAKGSGTLTLQGTATGNFVVGASKLTVTPSSGNVASAGSILSTAPTAGVGYATGAGGTVTQGTSRTTWVTVNTVSGAITLVSAAGSATPFTFTVTNSAVAATDTVIVSQKSGTDAYSAVVSNVSAGSFKLTVTDLTGTTTEQPVFNFNVIKGVTS